MQTKLTAFDKTREVYRNLDPRVRLLLQLVGLGVGIYVVFKVIKRTNQGQIDKPNTNETNAISLDLEQLNKNPYTRQKISNSQASAYANKIFACMNGAGTYENELVAVFYNLFNDADFLAVSKAFGTRTILSKVYFVDDFRGTMTACIVDELDIDYIKKINSILSKKGIKRRV